MHVLIVAICAGIHDFDVFANSFQKGRNVGIHAGTLALRLFLGARLVQYFGDIVHEKRSEQNFVLIIQTPVKNRPRVYIWKTPSGI